VAVASANAETLDGLDSTQFLRSDVDDTGTSKLTLSSTTPLLLSGTDPIFAWGNAGGGTQKLNFQGDPSATAGVDYGFYSSTMGSGWEFQTTATSSANLISNTTASTISASDLLVKSTGSGNLTLKSDAGNVDILETGAGDVTFSASGGNVEFLTSPILWSVANPIFNWGESGAQDLKFIAALSASPTYEFKNNNVGSFKFQVSDGVNLINMSQPAFFFGSGSIGFVAVGGNLSFDSAIGGETIFNEAQADRNFRVESDGNANAIFVDASANRVGIFDSTPDVELDLIGDFDVTGDVDVEGDVFVGAGQDKATYEDTCHQVWILSADPAWPNAAGLFYSFVDGAESATENNVDDALLPGAPGFLFGNLRVEVSTAPGAGESAAVTLRSGVAGALANTALTCTLTAGTSCTMSASASVSGARRITIGIVTSAGAADSTELIVSLCSSPDI